jgi:2-polyprenyl-6-methoxyphenol hydroxylase-like FAD-dependent oxidoreductase
MTPTGPGWRIHFTIFESYLRKLSSDIDWLCARPENRPGTHTQVNVLIAGAGPVGLCAANVLADAGIPVTVLEAERRLPENLRASTFQPPTLDLLARFGATQRLIEMGRVAPRLRYRDREGWVAELDFGVIASRLTARGAASSPETRPISTIRWAAWE